MEETIEGYITRDNDECLYLWLGCEDPLEKDLEYEEWYSSDYQECTRLNDDLFPEVTFEDNRPTKVSITIRKIK